ncbi:MAG: hypothetical protein JO223_24545 [Hyphomicrobiales bacterium]|nr:hypothetical protein [Hyphomicrobiales bacterium]MBV8441520.1 hypothetical protein [Hyphomicrobiales bacterium]
MPVKFAANIQTAVQNFLTAVAAFNPDPITGKQDVPALTGTLSQNVILYGITEGEVVAAGIKDVVTHLTTPYPGGNAGSTFKPVPGTVDFTPRSYPVIVTGKADWTDNDGSPPGTISFLFTFDPGGTISSLWASSAG